MSVRYNGINKKKHFMGRRLASYKDFSEDGKKVTTYRIYKTAKGAYLLYTRTDANWNWWMDPKNFTSKDTKWNWLDPKNWMQGDFLNFEDSTSDYKVYASYEQLSEKGVPEKLIENAKYAEEEPDEEFLDI
ncbi:MAG: EXLDI protein [Micrococcaceae bacterium]